MRAFWLPATTANVTPSRIASMATAAACRAAAILPRPAIDPEQSIMMISAPPGSSSGARSSSADVTVTIALTSRPPSGRYSFWKTSTAKPVMGQTLVEPRRTRKCRPSDMNPRATGTRGQGSRAIMISSADWMCSRAVRSAALPSRASTASTSRVCWARETARSSGV